MSVPQGYLKTNPFTMFTSVTLTSESREKPTKTKTIVHPQAHLDLKKILGDNNMDASDDIVQELVKRLPSLLDKTTDHDNDDDPDIPDLLARLEIDFKG